MSSAALNFVASGRHINKERILGSIRLWDEYIKMYFRKGRTIGVYSSTSDLTPLYGGRPTIDKHVISYEAIKRLNQHDVGFMMTLTNHNFSTEAYKLTVPILEKIENKRNSVVVTNDNLAKAIRRDFPKLTIKSSVIKLLSTYDEIYQALDIYDYITIPPWINDNEAFLTALEAKDRMILFANSNCLYTCRKPTCYRHISDRIFSNTVKEGPVCRRAAANRHKKKKETSNNIVQATHVFDLQEPRYQGFTNFKLVPVDFKTVLSFSYIQEKYNN